MRRGFLLLAILLLLGGGLAITEAQAPWAGCRYLTAGTGITITCPDTVGRGGATIAASGGSGVSGSGTTGALTKWTNGAGSVLGDSLVTESGSIVTVGGSAAITQGTITAAQPVLAVTSTWNNSGVIFTGVNLNVTETAAADTSALLRLQRNGGDLLSFMYNDPNLGGTTLMLSNHNGNAAFIATPDATGNDQAPALLFQVGFQGSTSGLNGGAMTLTAGGTSQNTKRGGHTTISGGAGIGAGTTSGSVVLQGGFVSGGGVLGNVDLGFAGVAAKWRVVGGAPSGGNSGDLIAVTDGGVDIGSSGANRPRNIFLSGTATIPTVNATTAYQANAAPGVSATKTVRDSAGTGTCTLIFTFGILTGGTC